jgi:hypothetical protein
MKDVAPHEISGPKSARPHGGTPSSPGAEQSERPMGGFWPRIYVVKKGHARDIHFLFQARNFWHFSAPSSANQLCTPDVARALARSPPSASTAVRGSASPRTAPDTSDRQVTALPPPFDSRLSRLTSAPPPLLLQQHAGEKTPKRKHSGKGLSRSPDCSAGRYLGLRHRKKLGVSPREKAAESTSLLERKVVETCHHV